jgi:hypothetical protein
MIGIRLKLAAIVVLAPMALIGTQTQAPAQGRAAAIVGGIIAGAAIGAAVSGAVAHPQEIYVPGPGPRPGWADAFSPAPNVTCYGAQRACYRANGAYAPNWTWQVFSR